MKDKRNLLLFVIGFFLFWVNGDNYAAAALVLGMSEEFGASVPGAAVTVVAYMLGFGVFTLFFGPLGDRFGKTRILKIAAMGSAIGSIASSFMPGLGSVIAVRAVNGVFSAGVMPVAMAYIGENSAPESRHADIARVMGMMFLGGAAATVIGGALSYLGSWRLVYLTYGAAEILLMIPLFILLPRGVAPHAQQPGSAAYAGILKNRVLLRTVAILFFLGISTLGTFSYLGEFLRISGYGNLIVIGLILAAYGAGTMIGGRVGGRLKMKLKAGFLPFCGMLGGLGFTAFRFAGLSPGLSVTGLFLAGFAFVGLQSTIVASAQDLAPMNRGSVMSIASFTMVTSAALGTFINGRVFQIFPGAVIWLSAALIILSGLLSSAGPAKKPIAAQSRLNSR